MARIKFGLRQLNEEVSDNIYWKEGNKMLDAKVLDLIILLEDCDQDKNLTYEQIAYKIMGKLGIETQMEVNNAKENR